MTFLPLFMTFLLGAFILMHIIGFLNLKRDQWKLTTIYAKLLAIAFAGAWMTLILQGRAWPA
jgi:hypothetical protein